MAALKYPGMRYHETEPPCTVQSPEEEKALGSGWVDSPDKLSPAGKEKNASAVRPVVAVNPALPPTQPPVVAPAVQPPAQVHPVPSPPVTASPRATVHDAPKPFVSPSKPDAKP